MLAPARTRAVRDEQALRMSLLSTLTAGEARQLVHHYLSDAEGAHAELLDIAAAADAEDYPRGRLRFGRLAIEYGIRSYQAQQEWARWALEQLGTSAAGD
ncbi:hypothetical protein AB0M46_04450 [Dactylosporangium sp. NPDC051485]|uniref:hypothetical protein n=1 Tax=Dactylosporangium sp. NPDC051485 TaxID=3154846 RepID=UPI0034332204